MKLRRLSIWLSWVVAGVVLSVAVRSMTTENGTEPKEPTQGPVVTIPTERSSLPRKTTVKPATLPGAEGGTSPDIAEDDGFTEDDYARHVQQLKKKVPAEGFTIIVQRPFVVIGDEAPAMVRRRAEGTVQWAVDQLKAAYFAKDPARILDVWLFKDAESYEKHCKAIFNREPTTPYGFYSSGDGALIMNIRTGGGTLVHEIVHPFMAANFPECPAWLNEGLGSLYEQSAEADGRIVGLTNWRLAGLQKGIERERVPSFETLCATTDHQFYKADPGTNYAQARYLCYYLQEKGLLRDFYRTFRANHEQDPTGYETLKAVLETDDMAAFQKQWEAFVLALRFP